MGGPIAGAYGVKDHLEEAFRGVVEGEDKLPHLVAAYRNFHWLSLDGAGEEKLLSLSLGLIVQLTKKKAIDYDTAVDMLLERHG